jgi:hypothetical protein
MTFKCAQCSLCTNFQFDITRVIAFGWSPFEPAKPRHLVPVDLDGREPWCGVRCVCVDCARTIERALGSVVVREDGVEDADDSTGCP